MLLILAALCAACALAMPLGVQSPAAPLGVPLGVQPGSVLVQPGAVLSVPPEPPAWLPAALATVRVQSWDEHGEDIFGSAVPVGFGPADAAGAAVGLYLTAAHVVQGRARAVVELLEPGEEGVALTLPVAEWRTHALGFDAALLAVPGVPARWRVVVPVAAGPGGVPREPVPGERIVSAGYPKALGLSIGTGYATHRTTINNGPCWRSSAWCFPGHSGGAVLTMDGALLGITVARDSITEGVHYFLPCSVLVPGEWR